jgi:predicted Rossmann fold flavoprotein
MNNQQAVVIGGGAAGFFCAISIAEFNPDIRVLILESGKQTLRKVKISGGGRCNLTHHCFEPQSLVTNYPRGQRELLGPFFQWQPNDMIRWFYDRGISTKTEEDGRVFPLSNSSQSIIECFESQARNAGIQIIKNSTVTSFGYSEGKGLWQVNTHKGETHTSSHLCVACGTLKNSRILSCLEKLGHSISPPIPSLFAFNIPSHPLAKLSGLSLPNARVSIPSLKIYQDGPILVTHRGVSGPAVIKLSSWAAQKLFQKNYRFTIEINWLGAPEDSRSTETIKNARVQNPKSSIAKCPFQVIPKRLWQKLLQIHNIPPDITWSHLSRQQEEIIWGGLVKFSLPVEGKTTNKEEFVTCGGVTLNEINFKTMESKKIEKLFFAGECLDIDGVTGGFNFQSAWTTARLAAKEISAQKDL